MALELALFVAINAARVNDDMDGAKKSKGHFGKRRDGEFTANHKS